jgi:hypothetical protein
MDRVEKTAEKSKNKPGRRNEPRLHYEPNTEQRHGKTRHGNQIDSGDSVCTPAANLLTSPRIRTREARLNKKQEQNRAETEHRDKTTQIQHKSKRKNKQSHKM